jgi:hypothetical protein
VRKITALVPAEKTTPLRVRVRLIMTLALAFDELEQTGIPRRSRYRALTWLGLAHEDWLQIIISRGKRKR